MGALWLLDTVVWVGLGSLFLELLHAVLIGSLLPLLCLLPLLGDVVVVRSALHVHFYRLPAVTIAGTYCCAVVLILIFEIF